MDSATNNAVIAGTIVTQPKTYNCCGEYFYSFNMSIARQSGTEDIVPVNISKWLLPDVNVGDKYCFNGQIRTYNRFIEGKRRLVVSFFAQEISDYEKDINQVTLHGYFCKEPKYRKTPSGRDICDLLLAVNRERGISDYIPCIVWGRAARFVGDLNIGTEVEASGRFQSRDYEKTTENGIEKRTTYEISLSNISECDSI